MEWMRGPGSTGGQIAFVTHQLLPHIPFFPSKHEWHALVDEVLQVHDRHTLRIPHSHSILTEHVALERYNAIYSRLVCKNAKAVTAIAKNNDKDAIFEVLSQAARDVKNCNWECYVNTEDFERLLRGEAKELDIYTVLSPRILGGFRSVFMASANFRDTVLYHLWQERGVTFDEDIEFTRSLRFDQHSNGRLIKVLYAIDEPWSRKRQGDTWADCGNQTTLQLAAESAVKLLGNSPFVWQTNKGDADALKPLFGENQQLPHLAFGLNDFSHVNNVVLLTASNPAPDQYRFLRNRGMDSQEVRRAIYFQNAYQTVLRTSIRDPNNVEPKTIIVPDLPFAEYLQQLFPGSTVERLPTGIPPSARQAKVGRPRKHHSDQQRKAHFRHKAKQELLQSNFLLDGIRPYVVGEPLCVKKSGNLGDETPIGTLPEFRLLGSRVSHGCIFTNKHNTTGLYVIGTNVDDFIGWLEHLSHREVSRKDANQLISPAIFDPNHPNRVGTQARGLGNIVYMRHLWLDFEDGTLPPDELPKLFPNTRMVVMNSYHHTATAPRFHVFIPVRQRLTPEAYEVLWDIMAEKLEDAGYQVGKSRITGKLPQSGLDRAKRTPASLFYLPCQAENPSQA